MLAYPIYLAVSIILYLFVFRVKHPKTAFFGLLVSLLIPPFGLIFAIFLRETPNGNQNEAHSPKTPAPLPTAADVEYLRVPMSEALILNGHAVCCTLLLDALKNDPSRYLFGIREALEKGDPETAHYAAAAVMDIQNDLLLRIKQLSVKIQNQQFADNDLYEYAGVLKKSLDSKLFDPYNESQLQARLEAVLNFMILHKPSPKAYSELIELAIRKRGYPEALRFASEYLLEYPHEEDAYLYYLQCLMTLRDTANLQAFVGGLKNRPVRLTARTLQYVRYLKDKGIVG